MTYCAYILRCADGTLYSGYTADLVARVAMHNAGRGAKYTRSHRPVHLVYFESFATKEEALAREAAIKKLGGKPEITRFKGLGEISPDEFSRFIGEDMRKQPVLVMPETHIQQVLEYYMGKNTPQRQDFIIENLKVELDLVEEEDVA